MASGDSKNALGIYISPKEICIAQVRPGKNQRPELEHIVKFPTNFAVKEGMLRPLSLNNEFFSEKASWLAPFAQAVKQVNWNSSAAFISLSPHFGILRYFVMPVVDRKFWGKAIPLESKKYIPVSFDEVSYDFEVEPIDGAKKLGVLFGLTQRKSVEFLINVLKENGLSLAGIEMAPASLERLFAYADPNDHESKAYIHFHGNAVYMMFSSSGCPVLYRESEGGEGMMSERKRLDIKGAVQFVDRYVGAGQKYKDLRLSGDSAEAWKPQAEKESETIPASVWDPAGACSLKDNSPVPMFAVGAALRDKTALRPRLDVSGLGAAARLEKEVQTSIWAISGALGGILLLLSIIGQVRLMGINSKLSSLESQVAQVPELQGLSGDDIRVQIENARSGGFMLERAYAGSEPLAPKLAAVADNLPPDLWISSLRYANPIALGEKNADQRELTLLGETFLSGQRKTLTAEVFLKSLRAAPEFKVFMPPKGSLEYLIPVAVSAETSGVSIFQITGKTGLKGGS